MRVAKLQWRLYENERCLGVFSKDTITEITGMGKSNISTYADTGAAYRGVYRIEKVEDDFAQEWEVTTRKLLRLGCGRERR